MTPSDQHLDFFDKALKSMQNVQHYSKLDLESL